MAYPTDDPIRKKILANIRTTLLAIQAGATYRTTVRGVEHLGLNEVDIKTYPFVAIGPPQFRFDDGQYRRIAVEMTLTLLLVIRTQTSTVETMHDFLEDVSLAMRADVTRGGFALDTHVRGDSPDVPDGTHPVFATEVELAISYRHLNTDPALQL